MTTTPNIPTRRSRAGNDRLRGFSFVEVLFAVMILGIGFILIAGIFPVALSQTASTQEETVGAAATGGAVAAYSAAPYLQESTSTPSGYVVPPNNEVSRLLDDAVTLNNASAIQISPWSLVKGSQILSSNPRFGWVALLKREATDYRGQVPNTAQLIIIPCQVRGRDGFNAADLTQVGTGDSARATLLPLPVQVQMTDGGDDPDTCVVSGTFAGAAAPGAVVVLKNGSDGASPARPCAGRIYRLGNLQSGNTYELLPGNDLATAEEQPSGTVDAYIVGRATVEDPANPGTLVFDGPSIAIGSYVTYISLK